MKGRWSLECFLWNSKEEEGESNESKLSRGVAGGGGSMYEPWESQLRISFDFSSKTSDTLAIISLMSLQHENPEQFEIVKEWDELLKSSWRWDDSERMCFSKASASKSILNDFELEWVSKFETHVKLEDEFSKIEGSKFILLLCEQEVKSSSDAKEDEVED